MEALSENNYTITDPINCMSKAGHALPCAS